MCKCTAIYDNVPFDMHDINHDSMIVQCKWTRKLCGKQ